MKKITSALFDLDGTLCNTLDDLRDAVNSGLCENGLAEIEMDKFIYCVGSGAKYMIKTAVQNVGGDCENDDLVQKIVDRFTEVYAVNYAVKTKPYENMVDIIRRIKNAGIKLAVITNKPYPSAKTIVEKCFGNLFDVVVGSEMGFPIKPDKTIVYHVLDIFKAKPEDAVFIGDSDVDIKTAINSEITGIAVDWGYRNHQEQLAAGAEIFAYSPEEMGKMILTGEGL